MKNTVKDYETFLDQYIHTIYIEYCEAHEIEASLEDDAPWKLYNQSEGFRHELIETFFAYVKEEIENKLLY